MHSIWYLAPAEERGWKTGRDEIPEGKRRRSAVREMRNWRGMGVSIVGGRERVGNGITKEISEVK